jgi:hypothetical protein
MKISMLTVAFALSIACMTTQGLSQPADAPAKDARPTRRRPWMAATTRSGARIASEIVMLTLRMLHLSRLAILSALAAASDVSSSSHRRPRAIDATGLL